MIKKKCDIIGRLSAVVLGDAGQTAVGMRGLRGRGLTRPVGLGGRGQQQQQQQCGAADEQHRLTRIHVNCIVRVEPSERD